MDFSINRFIFGEQWGADLFWLRIYPRTFCSVPDPGNAGGGIDVSDNFCLLIKNYKISMMKDFFIELSWQECLGFVFSVIQVVLARYNNPKNYLFGIAGIILSLFVMYNAKLYAEFTLSLYYLVMSIYGWLYWKYGKQKDEIEISKTNNREWITVGLIVTISFFIFYFALTHFTDSDVPVWDSLVSAFAWAGMWLMAKRKLENWILLNISNIISIPLMVHKKLYLYALLSFILFSVAISGYMNWRNILKGKNA